MSRDDHCWELCRQEKHMQEQIETVTLGQKGERATTAQSNTAFLLSVLLSA